MALRNIMNYKTDDILRKRAKTVENFNSLIPSLLVDMTDTMYIQAKLINPVIVEAFGEQQVRRLSEHSGHLWQG